MQLAKRVLAWDTEDLDSNFDPIIKTKQTYELEQVTQIFALDPRSRNYNYSPLTV